MRRRRFAGLALATLTGCNGFGDGVFGGSGPDPAGAGTPSSAPTATGAGAGAGAGEGADRPTATSPGGDRGPPLAGLFVRNASTRDRYATVVVTDGAREVVESRSVAPAASIGFPALVARPGTYRVVVETADGRRATADWRAAAPLPDLAVDLRAGVAVRRLGQCTPACPPLSTVRTGSPPGEDARTVVVDNGGDRERVASVRVDDGGDGDRLLDADYRVPARSRLRVPVARRPRYRATVATDGGVATREWAAAAVPRLTVDVAPSTPAVRCRDLVRDLVVANPTDASRQATVAVTAGDDTTLARVDADVDAGASRTVRGAIPPAGGYTIAVETADGLREEYVWTVCPPVGPVEVVLAPDDVRVSVRAPRPAA
jgi:hypothetical protein